MAKDRGGTLLTRVSEGEGHVPRVHGEFGRGVAGGTPQDPVWDDLVTSMGVHPAHPTPQTLQGLLSVGIWVDGIPSGGLQGAGVNAPQPLESICALPRAGCDSDSGGR